MKGNWTIRQLCAAVLGVCAAATTATSCAGFIFDDRSGCVSGVQVSFRYDYNLQRADMFEEHVGEVTVYVFDGQGRFILSQTTDSESVADLSIDLQEGAYYLVALAHQDSYTGDPSLPGAQFIRTVPDPGGRMADLQVVLECGEDQDGVFRVSHDGLPLDTLWHAWTPVPVSVGRTGYTDAELSLVRDTKRISVSVRDLDKKGGSRTEDYDMTVTDSNGRLYHDNSVDGTAMVRYTPYVVWNTAADGSSDSTARAEFMTSRIVCHDDPAEDARLRIVERASGQAVVDVSLPDLLGSMAGYDELQRYSSQEFLDRGYDYSLSFYLSGGDWKYLTVTVGVLGWSRKIQNVDI